MPIEAMSGLTMKEVKQVLKDIAWREVREVWREAAAKAGSDWELNGCQINARCGVWR